MARLCGDRWARFSRWFLSYGLNHPGPVDPGQTADIEELSRVSLAVIPVLAQLHEQDFAAGSDKARLGEI